MRLSTAMTPRVVACAEDLPQFVGLPRAGAGPSSRLSLNEHGSALKIEDERIAGSAVRYRFQGQLTAVQMKAVHEMLKH